MATLQEVIAGLEEGRSFKRDIPEIEGSETVKPAGDGFFHHNVWGTANGGGGGAATLSIDILTTVPHWAKEGWEPVS